MTKICENCGKVNKSNYISKCQTCYNKIWMDSQPLRKCHTCHREYKAFGINCYSCAKKIRDEKQKGTPCSCCHRDTIKIVNKRLKLCNKCMRLKREKDIPGYREERILYNRKAHRKYRGQNPEGPLRKKNAGEGYVNVQGYKKITRVGHPNAHAKGAILEHTWIMSEYLGRPLRKGESVHHINGDRLDNRIENLELWDRSQPAGQRVEDKIKWCIEYLRMNGINIVE